MTWTDAIPMMLYVCAVWLWWHSWRQHKQLLALWAKLQECEKERELQSVKVLQAIKGLKQIRVVDWRTSCRS